MPKIYDNSLDLSKSESKKPRPFDVFIKQKTEELSIDEENVNRIYNELNRIIIDYDGLIRINSCHEAEAHDMVRRKIGDAVLNVDRRTLDKVIERFRNDIAENRALYSKNNFRNYLTRVIVVVHIAKMKRCN